MGRAALVFGLVLLLLIVGVVGGSGAWVFWEAWQGSDRDVYKALVGAFAGAFFAFTSVRVGEALKGLYERQEKNHSALVRAEHYLNHCLASLGDNKFIVDDYHAIITETRLASGVVPVFMNRFHALEIDRALLLDFSNIDFVNEMYSFNGTLKKIDGDLATANKALDQVTDGFIGGKISLSSYLENLRTTRTRWAEVRGFLEQTIETTIHLLATAQLQLKSPPFFVRLVRLLTRRTYSESFKRALPAEVARVRADMGKVREESSREIAAAQARTQQDGQ